MVARLVQRKLTELGRIRLGDRVPTASGTGTRPHKLGHFRLTSPNRSLLSFAAASYGGEVRPWEGEGAPRDEHGRPTQFEVYTAVTDLDVLIPTMSALSLSYELWSASGCQRRCTGEVITHCPLQEHLVDTACCCPADDHERQDLASKGKACARILRLNVLLPDLPGMGVWRLETKGFYATSELLGTLDMLRLGGQEHQIIEAVLRLEQRSVKRPGTGQGTGTLSFAVPVLWPKWSPRQILGSAAGQGPILMSAPPQLEAVKSLEGHISDLYGDPPAPGMPSPPAANPEEADPDSGRRGGQSLVEAIATLHRVHGGKDEAWLVAYWSKVCRQSSVPDCAQLPLSTLTNLHKRVRDHYLQGEDGPAVETPMIPATETSAEQKASHDPD